MSLTKGQLVSFALEEIGYAAYVYDLMPEQLDSVLRSLDAMMASWNANGIYVGYPLSDPQNSSLTTNTGITDAANEAIYLNLAIRICSRFGKTASSELKQTAKAAYDSLIIWATTPQEMQFSRNLPTGAGNKPWMRVNTSAYVKQHDNLNVADSSDLNFN